ncbi:hypothetical protein RvY_05407 [Ramazzottius varieornatus]|uniref:Large ribosomal subunit protein uL10m n=1 Tax=Ramazzottius varieornatus TaxID=947166 RepID=A0A1D1V0J6_RAMVA|nr:hypothetical protein RvY_05407 [Ramazzottius varieornatus]
MLSVAGRCWSAGLSKTSTGITSLGQLQCAMVQYCPIASATHNMPALVVIPSRHMAKTVRTKNPRSPHLMKAKLLKAMEPIYAPDLRTPAERCSHKPVPASVYKLPPHPLEILLARETLKVIAASKMVVICHRNNMGLETLKGYRNAVWKLNMRLWPQFNNKILRLAFEGTKYATLSALLESTTMMVTSPELSFTNVVTGLKRIPTITPLAVVVNGEYIISVPQLENFAKRYKSGIVDAHGELVASLSTHSQTLLQALMHQGVTLSSCLSFMSKSSTVEPPLSNPVQAPASNEPTAEKA